jgi:hypothetical protein
LEQFLRGCGWTPYFVEGDDPETMHRLMADTMDRVIHDIQQTQQTARSTHAPTRPRWPMIVLRSPKGWTGPKVIDGLKIEGTFRAHQVPILVDSAHPDHVADLDAWMRSYKAEELFDEAGRLLPELAALAPAGDRRRSSRALAYGAPIRRASGWQWLLPRPCGLMAKLWRRKRSGPSNGPGPGPRAPGRPCSSSAWSPLRGRIPPAGNPGDTAQGQLASATAIGWRDVLIGGDPAAQHALRFALYHLNGAANLQDEIVSIAARALTGADYHGHVFWDTEIFLLPFYTLTWPEAARALLTYRFRTLDGARAKAERLGFRGAMYAWESADTGAETCPQHAIGPDRRIVDILCGTQELHISADVAYAVWHYWEATGDDAFLQEAGAEILLETARF